MVVEVEANEGEGNGGDVRQVAGILLAAELLDTKDIEAGVDTAKLAEQRQGDSLTMPLQISDLPEEQAGVGDEGRKVREGGEAAGTAEGGKADGNGGEGADGTAGIESVRDGIGVAERSAAATKRLGDRGRGGMGLHGDSGGM